MQFDQSHHFQEFCSTIHSVYNSNALTQNIQLFNLPFNSQLISTQIKQIYLKGIYYLKTSLISVYIGKIQLVAFILPLCP